MQELSCATVSVLLSSILFYCPTYNLHVVIAVGVVIYLSFTLPYSFDVLLRKAMAVVVHLTAFPDSKPMVTHMGLGLLGYWVMGL